MNSHVSRLGELCDLDRKGLQSDDPLASQLPYVGVENVRSVSGILDFDSASRLGRQKSTTFRFDERHVLYAKLRPYLNKVATPEFSGKCSTELVPLLPRDGIDREFVAHLLRRKETIDFVMKSVTGSRMPRTDMKALLSMPVPLPPLDEQRRIVGILNRAAKIERLRAQAADRLREFIPALFVKMFGDPAENPMEWSREYLGEISEVQGGLQVTSKREKLPLQKPYLRVANVLRDRLDLSRVKEMRVTEKEFERVKLRQGDLLVVEGHGNAAEIGRTAIWDGSVSDCVHQNHLIRVRLDRSIILPEFACEYLNSSSGRQHLLLRGKTTSGLNTITTSDVKSCAILVPPLRLQSRYRNIVETARNVSATASFGASVTTRLTASLMSRLLGDAA